jgi:hypothetical protein
VEDVENAARSAARVSHISHSGCNDYHKQETEDRAEQDELTSGARHGTSA